MNRRTRTRSRGRLALLAALAVPAGAHAQTPPYDESPSARQGATLDSIVALALVVNPSILAAEEQMRAASARTAPASSLSDPRVGIGVMNLPVTEPGYGDMMTMNTFEVMQTLPYPGKLQLARRIAEAEFDAAAFRLRATELEVAAQVRHAYYDLAYLDRALEVLLGNQRLLVNLLQVAESRYAVGTGGQEDVLKARVESTHIAGEAVALTEGRRAALARLNALLDRPVDTPLSDARVPERIALAAIPDDTSRIGFVSSAIGARAMNSPLPALEEMQQRALQSNPLLREHEAAIAAETAHLDLARRAHLPDFDLSVQYGQRPGESDMVSLMVSIPVPVRRRDRQNQEVVEREAELAALEAEHRALVNRLGADVARLHAELERDRTQLALFVKSVIPQGRAALESATAAFHVGRADFTTLVEHQALLYEYETVHFRALTDFAKGIAELERIIGAEVLP